MIEQVNPHSDWPGVRTDDLAEVLGALARSLHSELSPHATLDAITRASVETVPGAEAAGVTLVVSRHEVIAVATTETVVAQIDQDQKETGQGPCLSALWEHTVIRMNDVNNEQRWPDFIKRLRGHNICSMLCFRLFTAGNVMGALNLYAREANAFPIEAEDIGQLFATHAGVALADAQKIEQLEQAVNSRDLIGQAKGILMERYKLAADDAFRLLVHASQNGHVKLRDIAERVASTGQDPSMAGEQQTTTPAAG